VGDEDSEEVLRREMAMGADNGILLSDDAFDGSDGRGIAAILKAAVKKGKYDLILTGAQADDGAAQVGGMLAAMLDWPYASVVNNRGGDGKLKVGREIEGGNQEMNEIELPCVLSIQTGINEPRYVGIRGIRKVASVEIPCLRRRRSGPRRRIRRRRPRQGQTGRLLRARTGRGRRNPGRQHGRKDRQAD
jgi:electron transfer flavoprotein beta subunit